MNGPGRVFLTSANVFFDIGRIYSETWLTLAHIIEYLACFTLNPFNRAIVSTDFFESMLQANAYKVSVGITAIPPSRNKSATRRTSFGLGLFA